MSLIKQRARIARVRKIQHDRAALAASKAAGHVRMLESNDERLGQMRRNLGVEAGQTTGAVLASRGELALRLEQAREGLGVSIKGARAASALREQARLGARRDQESAEKLQERAASAAARAEDRRVAARFRPRQKPKENQE
jgi:hypothetical protein